MTISKYITLQIAALLTIVGVIGGSFDVQAINAASTASFYISPGSGSYTVGDTISASLMIDSSGQAINAGEGSVSYPTDTLEFQSVSTSGSIFTFWTSGPTSSNTVASFGGGLSNPGYNGSSGKVLTITWKAKSAGVATVSVSGLKILANDGIGTNVYNSSRGASYTINAVGSTTAPTAKKSATVTVSSSTHPDQNKWYAAKDISLSWRGTSGINAYKYSFDQNASGDPASVASSTSTKSEYKNTADGIWYFHISGTLSTSTTGITNFKIQVDATPPDPFELTTTRKGGSTDPAPVVSFEAKDAMSGIAKYEARIDNGEVFEIKSGDQLPKQKPGNHTLVVTAIDQAGNKRESSTEYRIVGISAPTIIDWTKSVGLLSPISFIGRTQPDDTIFVYLNGREVGHFLAKDKQIQYSGSSVPEGEIVWEYKYTELILPGQHSFRFSRTNSSGAESEQTGTLGVRVLSDVIRIGGHEISTRLVLFEAFILILLLLLIIAWLIWRLRRIARSGKLLIGTGYRKMRDILSIVEKRIDRRVEHTLDENKSSINNPAKLDKQLESEVHDVIEDAKDEF